MAGAYWGDMPDNTEPIECEIVANASDVPEDQWANRRFPASFAVEMRGADRWPRASPSGKAECGFTTDCSPYNNSQEGQPNPPTVWGHWYSGIHGLLYVDHKEGQFGGGLLRHETVYEFPSGEVGAKRALAGHITGETNMHLTEIHLQTPAMADALDPGIMLNLVHANWSNPQTRTTCDEDNLDWRRIPSPPISDALCVCVPDPAGLPYFEGAYDNATYKGRISFTPPWQTTGAYGPPTGKKIVADHWSKWTFHLFVDVETNKPVLFSSPYGGVATYGNWSEPDELWPKDFNGGWKNLPTRESCFDPTMKSETCKDYTRKPVTTATTTPSGPTTATTTVTTGTTTAPAKHGQEFLMGLLTGLVSDGAEMDTCVIDGITVVGSFSTALGYLKKGNVGPAIEALSDALGSIQPAVQDCTGAKVKVQQLVDGLKSLSPAKAKANVKAHHSDILAYVAEASKCKDTEDFAGMGVQIGSIVRKIIEEDGVMLV